MTTPRSAGLALLAALWLPPATAQDAPDIGPLKAYLESHAHLHVEARLVTENVPIPMTEEQLNEQVKVHEEHLKSMPGQHDLSSLKESMTRTSRSEYVEIFSCAPNRWRSDVTHKSGDHGIESMSRDAHSLIHRSGTFEMLTRFRPSLFSGKISNQPHTRFHTGIDVFLGLRRASSEESLLDEYKQLTWTVKAQLDGKTTVTYAQAKPSVAEEWIFDGGRLLEYRMTDPDSGYLMSRRIDYDDSSNPTKLTHETSIYVEHLGKTHRTMYGVYSIDKFERGVPLNEDVFIMHWPPNTKILDQRRDAQIRSGPQGGPLTDAQIEAQIAEKAKRESQLEDRARALIEGQ